MRYTILFFILLLYSSCKKSQGDSAVQADMQYTLENSTVLSSDTSPLVADINNDGVPDYTFIFALTTNSAGSHLNIVTNSVNGASTITSTPDNTLYSNAGWVYAHKAGYRIDGSIGQGQQWNTTYGLLAIKHTTTSGTTYEGSWGDETEQMMALKLDLNGKTYFGWARLKYNRSQNMLTLVDYAYNRIPGLEVTAGQK
jgi:hypothetical protein